MTQRNVIRSSREPERKTRFDQPENSRIELIANNPTLAHTAANAKRNRVAPKVVEMNLVISTRSPSMNNTGKESSRMNPMFAMGSPKGEIVAATSPKTDSIMKLNGS